MNSGMVGQSHGLGPLVGSGGNTGMMAQRNSGLTMPGSPFGLQGLQSGPYGKMPTKEDNGSPPADIYNPDMTNVNGAFGNGGSMQQPYPAGGGGGGGGMPPGPSMGTPPPYSADSYGQSFAPFPNYNAQAQAAFNPLPQTNMNQYGRSDPTQWPGMVGTWPTLFGGPGAPAAQSLGTANVNGMTAPQQALNAQFQRWYGK